MKRPHNLPALDEGGTDTTDAQGGHGPAQEQGLGPGLGQASLAMMSDEDRRNLFDNSLELGPPTSTLTLTNQGPSTKPDKKPKGAGAGAGGIYGGTSIRWLGVPEGYPHHQQQQRQQHRRPRHSPVIL